MINKIKSKNAAADMVVILALIIILATTTFIVCRGVSSTTIEAGTRADGVFNNAIEKGSDAYN